MNRKHDSESAESATTMTFPEATATTTCTMATNDHRYEWGKTGSWSYCCAIPTHNIRCEEDSDDDDNDEDRIMTALPVLALAAVLLLLRFVECNGFVATVALARATTTTITTTITTLMEESHVIVSRIAAHHNTCKHTHTHPTNMKTAR